ncbi:Predicted transcriptional regulator [Frankineae bacterium MT45]|nr:Predicted transcriptional regulator [Frankineae bacterium MT45]
MAGQRRAAGGLEAEVLALLWAADRPMTAGDLVVEFGGTLAYNTVQTILIRLFDKGVVRRELVGRAHAYLPVFDDAGLVARRMYDQLQGADDVELVLSRFVDTLDPHLRQALRARLQHVTAHSELQA